MENLIVCKFGGSSNVCPENVEKIKKIVRDDKRRKIVVISAPGKRNNEDRKVTDMLIEIASSKSPDLLEQILDKYTTAYGDSGNLKLMLKNRVRNPSNLPAQEYLDSVKAFGEEASGIKLAEALGTEFISPRELFVVSSEFGNAKILSESQEKIKKIFSNMGKNKVYVVPGFYGYTKAGKIAAFSRGGSDLTGSYLAATLDSIIYENFTDRPGILAADPSLVDNPKKIDELTFEEARDLTYSGFSVFNHKAMEPVYNARVPVHVRSTLNYPEQGTRIVEDRKSNPAKPIIGVAYQPGFVSFDISKFGMNEYAGILAGIIDVFAKRNLSIEFVPSAIDDISIILKEKQQGYDVSEIMHSIRNALGQDTKISLQENIGCLVVAGKELKGRMGISADIQKTLAQSGANIKFISQGSQERCIVYGIPHEHGKTAVNAIYEKYIK